MRTSLRLKLAIFASLALSTFSVSKPAIAVTFENLEVDQSRFIAVAAPYGRNAYQLLVLEQITNSRECWSESGANPAVVEPLLLNFDFTGICGRSTDSNGYSVRVAGQDLGLQYSLRVVRQQNDLILLAASNTNRSAPEIEIGKVNGLATGFAKIVLNPGWRFTRRVYNGQPQGHVYLTNDQSLDSLVASVPSRPNTLTRPISSGPVTTPVVSPSPSATPGVVVPTLPSTPGVPATTAPGSTPIAPPTSGGLPTVPVNPPPALGRPSPPATQPVTRSMSYRVIVPASTLDVQNRVRAIAPGAFRTTVNGQAVVQAGLFSEELRASELQQLLISNNLQARIIPVEASALRPVSPPTVSTRPIPRGRVVVVIDPGHGGRDPGAIGIGGLREKDIVLPISRQVAALLEQQGIQVVMTRSDDRELDLAPRVRIAEQANANVFVSIHANAINMSRPDVNGLETYYNSSAGQRLAQVIHSNMLQTVGMRDRGVRRANFYVIRNTSMPSVLVEVGFVTGREDAVRLSSSADRNRMAQAIANGIVQYVRSNVR